MVSQIGTPQWRAGRSAPNLTSRLLMGGERLIHNKEM